MKTKITKQAALSCLLLVFTIAANAQLNLVKDPSFEDTTGTVDGWGNTSLKQWKNLDSTIYYGAPFIYFSYITQNPPYSLPNNQWCYQIPRSGGGCQNLILFGLIILIIKDLWQEQISVKHLLLVKLIVPKCL
jgi:hypothetical protein